LAADIIMMDHKLVLMVVQMARFATLEVDIAGLALKIVEMAYIDSIRQQKLDLPLSKAD